MDLATGTRFPLERPFPGKKAPLVRAVGSAVRTAFQVDEYCLALYVDLGALRAKAGRQRDPDDLARILCEGEVALGFPRYFLRGVGRNFRTRSLKESLEKHWPGGRFDPEAPSVAALLACLDQDTRRGDRVEFWFDGTGALLFRMNQGSLTRIQDSALCRALISNYLGESRKTEDTELRRALLAGLPPLLEGPTPR